MALFVWIIIQTIKMLSLSNARTSSASTLRGLLIIYSFPALTDNSFSGLMLNLYSWEGKMPTKAFDAANAKAASGIFDE